MKNDQLDKDVSELQQVLMQLSLASRKNLARELDIFGLTVPQYTSMRTLQRNPNGISMSDLANASHQVPATMTGIVDRLSERELVKRHQDPDDRRTQLVFMTDKGMKLITEIETRQKTRLSHVLKQLAPEERKEMLRLMTIYLRITQEELDDPVDQGN